MPIFRLFRRTFWGRSLGAAFRALSWVGLAGAALLYFSANGQAQAALLLEQPYGVFGTLNPTGHAALYLEHVCAETPVRLRECRPDENGVVISRYKGMAGYDWVAIPLTPYLYAVDDPAQVPQKADEETVDRLRMHYREARLGAFGESLPPGNFINGGWTQLIGTAYDRTTYAFRFETTREEDRALIAVLNDRPNASHFNLLYNNCADFDRFVLKTYFPHGFGRTIFPDAGITTPKHLTYALVQYAKRHPEMQLTVLEIPQVPGFRRKSRKIHGVTESLFVNGYVLPVVVLNPYVAGGLFADYLLRGRYHLIPKNPGVADAEHLDLLTQTPSLTLTPAGPQHDNPADTTRVQGVVQGNAFSAPAAAPVQAEGTADHE